MNVQRAGRAVGETRETNRPNPLPDLLKGAVAGAIGVWAMDLVIEFMWAQEDPRTRDQERRARPGGLDPAHVLANRAAEALGVQLRPKQPHPAGIVAHYALGIVPGAAYGVLRKRTPVVGAGAGLLYGLAVFLIDDELLNPLIGASGPPTEYPWQAHARGLVGHLVLGVATEAAAKALDRAM